MKIDHIDGLSGELEALVIQQLEHDAWKNLDLANTDADLYRNDPVDAEQEMFEVGLISFKQPEEVEEPEHNHQDDADEQARSDDNECTRYEQTTYSRAEYNMNN